MGLLSEGNPLTWEETKALAEHVRERGIQQFINLYNKFKDRQGDVFKWGDEVEYIVVKFDDSNQQAKVSLKAQNLLEQLNEKELNDPEGVKSLWRPEYAAFMIEGMPGKPYGGHINDFKQVEPNMRYRREEVTEMLAKDECVMSITNFPRLGCKEFSFPIYNAKPSKALYFPHEAIYPGHPRYQTATSNILKRRGEKLSIKFKVFKDKFTKLPVQNSEPMEPDVVVLDTTGFGMGCCCLQITFQACNVTEARSLYDQLAPLCPIMLAFTAASPIYTGYLTESDCRWNILSAAVDCRTPEERGVKPLKDNKFRIAKSRYDSIDSYISPEGERYNDVPVIYEDKCYQRLREGGIDHLLAEHIAHLFVRDTICLFSEKVHQHDEHDSDHFENIQSTNWQTMRFKPPPLNSTIGWRVEFRPCETQMSDFENAAIVCFVSLLTRVILSYKLDFLIPISKVDANMQTAQKRDACRKEKFWFRKNVRKSSMILNNGTSSDKTNFSTNGATNGKTHNINGATRITYSAIGTIRTTNGNSNDTTAYAITNGYYGKSNGVNCSITNGSANGKTTDSNADHKDELELMSIDEIFNGKPNTFPGLVPLVRRYLQSMEVNADTYSIIEQYLNFIQKRASGELITTATWMREQVLNHPDYQKDSIVSDRINYDILKKIQNIQRSKKVEPALKQREKIKQAKQIKDFLPLIADNHLDELCRSK